MFLLFSKRIIENKYILNQRKGNYFMKKVKMLALLATLALTAPVLAACGGNKQSNNPSNDASADVSTPSSTVDPSTTSSQGGDSSSAVKPVTRIDVDPPATVIEEQDYNLDDYIEVVGGKGKNDYEVEVKTEETAWVDGHTLSVIGVGDVQLLIKAGSKTARFNTVAVSALAYKYENAIKEVTNGWKIDQIYENDAGEEQVSGWLAHNPRYVLFYGDDEDESGNSKNREDLIGGGLIELRNGNSYLFNYFDNATKPVEIYDKLGGPLSNYIVGLDYDLPASVFETDYTYKNADGEKITALRVSRLDGTYDFTAQTSIFSVNLIKSLTLNRKSYVPHTIWLYPVVDANGQENWRMDMQMALASTPNTKATGVFTSWQFSFEEDDYTIDALDNHIDNAPLPATIPFDAIPNAFDRLISTKNYTLNSEVTICKNNDKENETDQFDAGSADSTPFLTSDMECSTRVDGEKYYSTSKGAAYMAAFGKNGAAYQVALNDDGTLGAASAISGATKLWDLDVVPSHLGTGAEPYNNFEVSKTYTEGANTCFDAIGSDVETWIQFFGLQDYLGRRIVGQFDALNDHYKDQGFDYYQVLDLKYTIGTDTIHVEFKMTWDKDADDNQYYAYIDFDYTAIGTTTVPELDSYVA